MNGDSNTGVEMVVFDWAGTTVDYASSAPAEVFERVFKAAGVELTLKEINGPMGMEKKAHIRALLSLERAQEQWKRKYERSWNEDDVERLYESFEDNLEAIVESRSIPIEGVVDTVNEIRRMGIKIGSTTGYNERIMKRVEPVAKSYGYEVDCIITPDATGSARPAPFMIFECMRRMNVYPASKVVKVGDTIVDIKEGKNAGAWSIGILTGSNLLGLSKNDVENLSREELKVLKKEAMDKYLAAGADMVIDTINELPKVIGMINQIIMNKREGK